MSDYYFGGPTCAHSALLAMVLDDMEFLSLIELKPTESGKIWSAKEREQVELWAR